MTTREHEMHEEDMHDGSTILSEANRPVREPIDRTEALISHGSARLRRASRHGKRYVREHTWRSLAGAALVGVLAGVCLMRHGRH